MKQEYNILYIVPKLPRMGEVAYSFIKEEIVLLRRKGVNSHLLEFNWRNLNVPYFIKKIIKTIEVDIIHAHFAFPYGALGSLLRVLYRKPLIITVHGFDVLANKRLGYGITRFSVGKVIVSHTLRNCCYIIANSRELFNSCIRLGIMENRVKFLPLGVDLMEFRPISLDYRFKRIREGYDFVILCAKSHERIYGINYLIRAFKLLKDEERDHKCLLVLVGGGRLIRNHMELVRRLGIAKDVKILGSVARRFMKFFYNLADVIVVPSLIEGFGLTVAEALACGRPVIGSAVGGILDQVVDGYNGFLVPPGDIQAIKEKLKILLNNQGLLRRMQLNARLFAEKNLDIKKRIDSIIKLYKAIVKK